MISKLKLMMTFAFIFLASVIYAQVPQLFNYQGIARDAKGNPMGNQRIALKISVLPASDATSPEYQETQLVTTNEFGLYNLQIGNGQALSGEMKTVKWETGNKYIQVAIDPKGGNNFEVAGTSQLLSVPYALYADKAGSSHEKTRTGAVSSNAAHVAGDVNYLTKFTAYNTIGKSQLFDNGTSVGIGTATPGGRLHIYSNSNSVIDHVRMHNAHTTGAGRFIMYNDVPAAYATFTKYGSTYPGGYAGMASLYPYANLLAFGNNGPTQGDGNGRFLISTSGNVGISVYKGSSKLKFHVDYSTLNVAIGGNTVPMSRVHFSNTDSTYMDLRLTNTTSGHTANDGLVISEVGTAASIINAENNTLSLGTNNATQMTFTGAGNVGVGTTTPTAKLDVNGQVRIQGGTPGAGKVLTSDASGLATWQTPGGGNISGSGTTNYVPKFTPNGTTLGNSGIKDSGALIYNAASQVDASNGMYINLGDFKSAATIHSPANGNHNYLNFTSNSWNSYQGIHFSDSARYYNWFLGGGSPDSVGSLYYVKSVNYMYLGNATLNKGLKLQVEKGNATLTGKLGIGTDPTVKLDVASSDGSYMLANFRNSSTTGDFTGLLGIKSANTTGPSQWLMGVGGTGNGLGLENNEFYIENAGKGSRFIIDTTGQTQIGKEPWLGATLNLGYHDYDSTSAISFSSKSGELFRIQENRDGQLQFVPNTSGFGAAMMTLDDDSKNVGIGTETPSERLDVIGKTKTTNLQMTNGGGAGKILTSDASGNASWSSNAKGTIAGVYSLNSNTLAPTNVTSFLSNTRLAITITSSSQIVQYTGTVNMGSNAVGGANALNIYPAYNTTNLVTPVTALGLGSFGLQCVQNTRNIYTVTYSVTGLAPGTYYFGVAGSSTSANWNNNEWGYQSAMLINN